METVNYNGRNHRVFDLKTPYSSAKVICTTEKYTENDTLAVVILCVEDGVVTEPYAVLTVNLSNPFAQSDTRAFVDTNNNGFWGCEDFIKKNMLAKPVGINGRSGYCSYPLYDFDLSRFTC